MRKVFLHLFLGVIFFATGCSGGGGSNPVSPSILTATFSPTGSPGTNNVTMEQISATGDEVTVAVKFNSIAEAILVVNLDLEYDSTVMTIVSVSAGDVLSGNFYPTSTGTGSYLISQSDTSVSSNQSGTFCTIVFRGISAGSGSVSMFLSSAILNGSKDPISGVSWNGGTVVVQ